MKWLKLFFFGLFFALPLTAANNTEFRATWVITWEIYSSDRNPEQAKARIRKILDDHVAANMNAVLWQARQGGTAYYQSSYEPWGNYLGDRYPGFDPLAYAVEQAHLRGLEIHAWVNCFHTSRMVPGTPAYEHPEWVCTNQDGAYMTSNRCLSPGIAAVRQYTVDICKEIAENYDVDGIHLDFCRWNEYDEDDMSSIMSEEEELRVLDGMVIEKKQLQKPNSIAGSKPYLYDSEHPYSAGIPDGFSSWPQWRRWAVTEFMRMLSETLHPLKPWVRISVAALGNYNWGGWNGYNSVFQDAALLFNEGYADQLTPMHYHWYNESPASYNVTEFVNMLWGPDKDNASGSCWGRYIQPGIQAGGLYTCGPNSVTLGNTSSWIDPTSLINQVRNVPWVDGFQFFSYGIWESSNSFQTAAKTYFNNRSKIRALPIRDAQPPAAPQLSVAMLDTFTYQITVTPIAQETEGGWIALYRAPVQPVNLDLAPILTVRFGSEAFTVTDTIRIGFNNTFTYAATAFDRSWNESELSNLYETPRIPAFSYTPNPIALNYIRRVTDGYEISWMPADNLSIISGYRLYGRKSGGEWELLRNERMLRSTATSVTVTGLEGDEWFFSVRPVGQGPLKIEATEQTIYGAGGVGQNRVLIVDAFTRRNGAWTLAAQPFTSQVCEVLHSLDVSFDCASRDVVISNQINLNQYAAIFWLCGDNDNVSDTIDLSSINKVTAYLRNGGCMLLSGSNIGLDLYEYGTRNQQAFFNTYLKAAYLGNGANGNGYLVDGTEDGIFNDLTLHLDDGGQGFDVSAPDIYNANDGSIACLTYSDDSGAAGIQYQGAIGGGTAVSHLLHFAFPIETLYAADELQVLIERSLTFFNIEHVAFVAEEHPVAPDFVLAQNYPNPFNSQTTFAYTLPKAGPVKLEIFNLNGQRVASLVDAKQAAGYHRIQWNAAEMATGLYTYRLTLNSDGRTYSQTGKMLYLK
ncbi:MAG TPA: family 10 glycosylhydrolase [bacterium]|nr:family 10 glycosylhydrolase [bacterium]